MPLDQLPTPDGEPRCTATTRAGTQCLNPVFASQPHFYGDGVGLMNPGDYARLQARLCWVHFKEV